MRLDHRLGGENRGRAADGAAGADQDHALLIHAQVFAADAEGQQKGGAQHQGVDQHAGEADGGDVLEGQLEAEQDDAQAQQLLFGELDAVMAGLGNETVNAVADQHAADDGDGQRGETQVFHRRQFRGVQGRDGERNGQRQARQDLAKVCHK